jgi:hypothetical protein
LSSDVPSTISLLIPTLVHQRQRRTRGDGILHHCPVDSSTRLQSYSTNTSALLQDHFPRHIHLLSLFVWQQRKTIFDPSFPDILVSSVVLSIGISPMFEYWTVGGLETPVQTLLFLATPISQVRYYLQRNSTNGIAFGLLLALLLSRTPARHQITAILLLEDTQLRAIVPMMHSFC